VLQYISDYIYLLEYKAVVCANKTKVGSFILMVHNQSMTCHLFQIIACFSVVFSNFDQVYRKYINIYHIKLVLMKICLGTVFI